MKNANLSIRFAQAEDLKIIGFLAQQTWPQTYRSILSESQIGYMMNLFYHPDSLKKQLLEQKHVFVLAEEEGNHPVGFASYSQSNDKGLYKLHKIYVLPSQQGKGLGKVIIDFIVEQIRPQGAIALQLNVNRYNKARQFYEKFGFRVIAEEDINIGNGYFMNDYVMELPLPG